jgi:hypothetical protein
VLPSVMVERDPSDSTVVCCDSFHRILVVFVGVISSVLSFALILQVAHITIGRDIGKYSVF